MGLSHEQRTFLREEINKLPLIDAHAHSIVPIHSSFPFLRCFSDAEHEAMRDVPYTLSCKRSLRDLAKLYACEASLESIEAHRKAEGTEKICAKCFSASNISSVLIDDGPTFDQMFGFDWHHTHLPNVHRVLCIEKVAEDILNEGPPGGVTWTLGSFAERFVTRLKSPSADRVVAFKSIAAYRSGLNVDPLVSNLAAEEGLLQTLQSFGPARISNRNFINFIFTRGLEIATSRDIPMQIQTGFGERNLELRFANPLHLRSVLEDKRFASSRLVLLHASYPYSKEVSHLASIYPQVHLDFGFAVPKLSVHGMESALSELLELAPLNKIMFSTDGHAFPETFFLGAKWAREIVLRVLYDASDDGDLSIEEAVQAADGIFQSNALRFYKLRLEPRANAYQSKEGRKLSIRDDSMEPHQSNISIKHIRLLWADGSGQIRCRIVPLARFEKKIVTCGVGLALCCISFTSHTDGLAKGSGLGPAGEIALIPDMTTQRMLPWLPEQKLVLTDMHLRPGIPSEYCPRSTLKRMSDVLQKEFGVIMNAGFEVEFYILKPKPGSKPGDENMWVGFDSSPYCSTAASNAAAPILAEICSALDSMGVPVEQLHAEAGGGQFEIALEYSSCMSAADNMLFLRETVKAVVQKHGLLATFLPKCFLNALGSGCHVHLSLAQEGRNVFMAEPGSKTRFGMSKMGEEFMAGVLYHLPSILAFTAPMPNSYDRIQPKTWSGAYQCWGMENREAALRLSCPPGIETGLASNFEVRSSDGCANPHLSLAAILAAGIDGLRNHLLLPEPIDVDPSTLKEGLVHKMPVTLDQAVAALQANEVMKSLLGAKLLVVIIAIRQSEIRFYKGNMDEVNMLVTRY